MKQIYRTNKPIKSPKSWRPYVLVLVGVVLVVGVFSGYRLLNNKDSTPKTAEKETIYYAPATDDEKSESEAKKDDIAKEQNENTSNEGSSIEGNIHPVITSADGTRATAYIKDVIEDGGTCTYTFTQASSGNVREFTSTGLSNASNTSCPSVKPNLANGKWKLVVTYSSPKVPSVASTPYSFEVLND